MYQLQRRIRMSCRIELVDACGGNMSYWHFWCVWSHFVQQLWFVAAAWLLLPPWFWLEQWQALSRRHLQPWCRGSVQQLCRRLRLPARVDELDARCTAVSGGQVQSRGRSRVQQLRRWLRVSGRLDVVVTTRSIVSSGSLQ
jgi:hypothetical protein